MEESLNIGDTEEDAKKKWCPFMGPESMAQEIRNMAPRQPGMGYSGGCGNPDFTHHGYNRCIGSECMMWRWLSKMELVPGETNFRSHTKFVKPERGYCGKAGQPWALS